MERAEIITQLTGVCRKVFNEDELVLFDEMTAADVDSWDSLSHMILITEVEEFFAIKFKLRELNKLVNMKVLIDIIEAKLN